MQRPNGRDDYDVDEMIAVLEGEADVDLYDDDYYKSGAQKEEDVDDYSSMTGLPTLQPATATNDEEKSEEDLRASQAAMKQDMEKMQRQMYRFMRASMRASSNRGIMGGSSSKRSQRRMETAQGEDDSLLLREEETESGVSGMDLLPIVESSTTRDTEVPVEEEGDRRAAYRRLSSFFHRLQRRDGGVGDGGVGEEVSESRPSIMYGRSSADKAFSKTLLNFFGRNYADEDDDFMDQLPQDSFSLLMTSPLCSISFAAAFMVYAVQVCTFFLMLSNLLEKSSDPGNPLGVPANVTPAVRVTQVILLTITALSQDAIRTGIALFFKGYTNPLEAAFSPYLSCFKFVLVNLLRIAEGGCGLVVTFLLVFDSESVIDLLLNFTAVEFISQLDEIFFGLAAQGFLGRHIKEQAGTVKDTKYAAHTVMRDPHNPSAGKERRGVRLHLILLVTWLALMAAWVFLMVNQTNGKYQCQSLTIQFEDDFVSSLGAFSGIYDIDSSKSIPFQSDRVRYIDRMSGKAVFAYCVNLQAWTFSFAEDGDFPDPCTDWVAHADVSKTFDILETQSHDWTVRNPENQEITIGHFYMKCVDCDQSDEWSGECNGHGTCSNAICQCDEGRYGMRCEFLAPCTRLEMDVRFDGFVDEREWSRNYELFVVDGEEIYAYSRPVYVNEPKPGQFDVVAFTGRRWMATHTDALLSANVTAVEDPMERKRRLGKYFSDHFHAYWSDFAATFITAPMDIGTEYDSATPVELEWHVAKAKDLAHPHEVQFVDRSVAPLDGVFLCSVCHNETNPCLNDGTCVDGQCECLIGSRGSVCQIPPTGNGRCDPQFDIPRYNYDGGDCCESTCTSGDVYHCGKDETGFVDLGYFFCIHEADEWHLNRASFHDISVESRYSMALSADGHMMVLGKPTAGQVSLYDADGSEWVRRGRVLEGPLGSQFGAHVAMSKGLNNTVRNFLHVDPVRIAVSGRHRTEGFVRMYECLTEGCSQSGEDIIFQGLQRDSRTVQDVSSDGNILAFGGFNATKNSTTIRFYHYEEAVDAWSPQGITELEFEGDAYALHLSGAFDTVAIRSLSIWEAQGIDEYHRNFEATDAKAVFHYDSQSNSWEQIGHTIYHHVDGAGNSNNPDDFHMLGTRHRLSEFLHGSDSIAISADGLVMAAGFPFSTEDPGVHVYEFDPVVREWVDRGHTIKNKLADGFKGWSVALSGDGEAVVVGTGGDATATNTYFWDGHDWVEYGHSLSGGELSSMALSVDGSVLAVAGDTINVFHRNIETHCAPDKKWFHLSLTLDAHPEDTRWELISNTTGEQFLSGGPYIGNPHGFPYGDAYERSTIVVETCVPRDDCIVFSLYDKLDPMTDYFRTPDGMLSPSVYLMSVDGVEVATRRLDQACDHYYIGDSCNVCPEGFHALKVLVRTCVPYFFTLQEATAGQVLVGDNSDQFSSDGFVSYIRDGTCQNLGLEVHSYWEESCVHVADLEHDCFAFDLGAHPNWPVVNPNNSGNETELDHAHRNTEVVIIFDDQQINVDLALVGSMDAGPPSEIHFTFGGACPGDSTGGPAHK
ncbi:Inherit from bactNOG: outer membrane autotransporter barrel [Seminavis robusta]|uniref:Inherit from bactNOG: outer membrane autotransporter barrel n=1 Tax=Seminavis robusta TaxID=568900 RepID=A0A9N8HGA7_9STRA|nr:Inherit from bactNOG: outer membrane autotransporter barrel [Seminavis robusta]|eukprot:Sro389_g132650.1 Inherit from bactNOG: outer membrane autotransporter barrel (1551) ;mRNA; f:44315-49484